MLIPAFEMLELQRYCVHHARGEQHDSGSSSVTRLTLSADSDTAKC